jgi:hypothetical protein
MVGQVAVVGPNDEPACITGVQSDDEICDRDLDVDICARQLAFDCAVRNCGDPRAGGIFLRRPGCEGVSAHAVATVNGKHGRRQHRPVGVRPADVYNERAAAEWSSRRCGHA